VWRPRNKKKEKRKMDNHKKRRIDRGPERRLLIIAHEEDRAVYLSAPLDCSSAKCVKRAIRQCPEEYEPGLGIALVTRVTRSDNEDRKLVFNSLTDCVDSENLPATAFDARDLIDDEQLKLWKFQMVLFVTEPRPEPTRHLCIMSLKRQPDVLYQACEIEAWWR
jgi:hypothetical protein